MLHMHWDHTEPDQQQYSQCSSQTTKVSGTITCAHAPVGEEDFFQKSLEFEPNHVGSLFGLATCYQHLGEKNKSLEVTNKILKINPKLTGVYRLISSMTSYKTDSNLISRIEELLENGTLENWQKADLYFSLSKGFDLSLIHI